MRPSAHTLVGSSTTDSYRMNRDAQQEADHISFGRVASVQALLTSTVSRTSPNMHQATASLQWLPAGWAGEREAGVEITGGGGNVPQCFASIGKPRIAGFGPSPRSKRWRV